MINSTFSVIIRHESDCTGEAFRAEIVPVFSRLILQQGESKPIVNATLFSTRLQNAYEKHSWSHEVSATWLEIGLYWKHLLLQHQFMKLEISLDILNCFIADYQ